MGHGCRAPSGAGSRAGDVVATLRMPTLVVAPDGIDQDSRFGANLLRAYQSIRSHVTDVCPQV